MGDTELRPLKSRFLVEMAIKIDYKCSYKRSLAHVASDLGPYNATGTSNLAWKALEILTFRGQLSGTWELVKRKAGAGRGHGAQGAD